MKRAKRKTRPRLVYKLPRILVESRNPDEAVNRLKSKARHAGCNAIVNLQRDRRTGEAWTSRYKYSIHRLSAEPALVKRLTYTSDPGKAALAKKHLDDEILKISPFTLKSERVTDASGIKFIVSLIGIGLVVAYLVAGMR